MIKFFRLIRQNLLNEGKVAKYFKYAIGEIVLVVIGILIALQVNDWNETRKSKENQIAYLNNLKKEVLQNNKDLLIKIDQYKLLVDNLTELSSLMKPNPASITEIKLNTLMESMTFMPVFKAIKTFTNSDNLETIDNSELKKLISQWNFLLENYDYDTKIIYDLYYNAIYPFVQENYQLKNMLSEQYNGKESSFPVNTTNILSNPIFENQVTMKLLNIGNAYNMLLGISDLHQEIIQSIDKVILEYSDAKSL